jgi:hypothetical protein
MAFNSFGADAFTNSFIKGFSFVDGIAANRRQENRLALLLEQQKAERDFQRTRQVRSDEIREADVAFTSQERNFQRDRQVRSDEIRDEDRDFNRDRLGRSDEILEEERDFQRDRQVRSDEIRDEDRDFNRDRLGRSDEILEEERDFQRDRQVRSDEIAEQTFAEETQVREAARVRQSRQRGATAALGSANPDINVLRQFADFPEVSAKIAQIEGTAQEQADLETTFGGRNLTPAEVAADPLGAEQRQAQAGLAARVQPVAPQETLAPITASKPLTDDELNRLADVNEAEALTLRDQQRADAAASPRFDIDFTEIDPNREENTRKDNERNALNRRWSEYNDINNAEGEEWRSLPVSLKVADYFDSRENLDPDLRETADRRMSPMITETIGIQQAAIKAADPGSKESRNGVRKLSEALGLQMSIHRDASPNKSAGVDDRGMPLGGPPALIESVLAQTEQAPGSPLPGNSSQQRADMTVVNRGTTSTRLSQRQMDSAFRLLKGGRMSQAAYDTYIQTGSLSAGTKMTIEQLDPTKDTFAVYTDAAGNQSMKLLEPARTPTTPKMPTRNLIDGEGLKTINRMADAYNTPDDPTRGTAIAQNLINVFAEAESLAVAHGYDYSNINDITLLTNRYYELLVVRDAHDAEWRFNGEVNPDFTQNYGSIAQALFNPKIDETFDRAALEEIEANVGPNPVTRITPLKARPAGFYDEVRENAAQAGNAEVANMSDGQIEELAQQAGR